MVSSSVQLRKVILLFWQLLAQGCGRHKSWLKQGGLEMRWEDLVLSFMSLHNARQDKGPDFLWWNKIFDKGEMSKNPPEVYLFSFIVSVNVERNMDRKWTPNLVYQRILKLDTGEGREGLNAWDKCLFLQKINQSLFLCISDSMRFVLFGFENIFIFCVAILLNSVGEKILLCALLSENLLV